MSEREREREREREDKRQVKVFLVHRWNANTGENPSVSMVRMYQLNLMNSGSDIKCKNCVRLQASLWGGTN